MSLLMMSMGLALAACAAPNAAIEAAPATTSAASGAIARADTVVLTGERAFAVAELAYITAADGVGRLVDAGVIRGATAERVRGWNAEARKLLVRGKATVDAAEKARAAASLFGFADKLNALIGSN